MTDPKKERQRALAERIVSRGAERIRKGELVEVRRLSAGKDGFPKMLCLDQNKWIDLARAHYGREDGAPFKDSLEAVRRAVASGTLVVPVTGANLNEASEPGDEARRERTARFLVELSGNQSLVNHQIVQSWEFHRAVTIQYLGRTHGSVRPSLLRPGMFSAAMGKSPTIETGDPHVDQIAIMAMYDPELAVRTIVDAIDRETIKRLREQERRATAVVEQVRVIDARLSTEERRQLELANLLANGSTAKKLNQILDELGIEPVTFRDWLREGDHLKVFTDDVPGIDVTSTLMLYRDQNQQHRAHPNDSKDFSFMRVALPYANIVVAEKSWSHVARASGVADRYQTVIETDATRLPDLLVSAKCL